MHVISRRRLREFWAAHPEAEGPLDQWYRHARKARWGSFAELRADYPAADLVGKRVVFNVGGNKFRLVAAVHFNTGRLYVLHVLTHKEYDRGLWKQE